MFTAPDQTVAAAVELCGDVPDDVSDEHQTAREGLSHLLFWHREYERTARALAIGHSPEQRCGTFAGLNVAANSGFSGCALPDLARQLVARQRQLSGALSTLPERRVDFPLKQVGRPRNVADRVHSIESQIR